MSELPRIVSVDDHVIEPPHVWQQQLPASRRAAGPTLVRRRGHLRFSGKSWQLREDAAGSWADCWSYEGKLFALDRSFAAISYPEGERSGAAVLLDELRPGCFEPKARLADMDANHTEASLCFPSFPRFCGQTFLEAEDRSLAADCVRAYNDWMIDDWCGGDARGRLIPLTLVPLWDARLAAAEVRRCAERGSHAIAFSESPHELGLPSVHDASWEPLWQACAETSTVINMHIGSSSKFSTTSPDAPPLVPLGLSHENAQRALVDWLCSGILERHGSLKIAFSEAQAGWIPFVLERLDRSYEQWAGKTGVALSKPPSHYLPGRVYTCIFEDVTGLELRHRIGMSQLMFETDYPHADSTWPDTKAVVERLVRVAGLDEAEMRALLRDNAIECYGLGRYGLC